MVQFVIFFILGTLGIAIGFYFGMRRRVRGQGAVGRRQAERDANIGKLKEYLRGRETVGNDEIEQFLGISDSTVTRYMDELQKQGFVEQVGFEGRHVYYRIK